MPRLRYGKGRFDGLEIPHLPDENYVWILPEDRFKSTLEGGCVGPHLALVDYAALVGVEELDRVFNGDYVFMPRRVDAVDHGSERRGLTAPGRTSDQYEPLGSLVQILHNLGQIQFFKGEDLERDRPDGDPHRTPGLKDVGSEPRKTFHAKGKIKLLILFKNVFLGIRKEAVGDLLGLGGNKCGHIQRPKRTVDPQLRRCSRRDVQVAGPVIHHELEQLVDTGYLLRILDFSGPVGRGFIHGLFSPHIYSAFEKAPHCKYHAERS